MACRCVESVVMREIYEVENDLFPCLSRTWCLLEVDKEDDHDSLCVSHRSLSFRG